jgi:membrane protein implicated in regulation of membrane protease activity
MAFVLVVLLVLAVAQLLLVGLAVAEGLLLHWLVPSIEVPIAVLIALVGTVATIYLALQIVRIALSVQPPPEDQEEEDDEDAPAEPPALYVRLPHFSRSRRRSRKSR